MQSDWLRHNLPRLIIGSMSQGLRLLPLAVALYASLMPNSGRAQSASASLPTVARLHYDGGGDWYANPSSLSNLLGAVSDWTDLRVAARPAEVRLLDPDLGDYPYLYMTGHGNVRFSEPEIERLRAYLDGGGFLHIDDNYGMDPSARREISRLFPERQLVEVPLDHPIYGIVYSFPDGLPKVHEHDGLPARGFGVFIDGRLALFYSWQSDLGDGWEDASVHGDPDDVRIAALEMGVNLLVYAITSSGAG
jgi:hypothetical protein